MPSTDLDPTNPLDAYLAENGKSWSFKEPQVYMRCRPRRGKDAAWEELARLMRADREAFEHSQYAWGKPTVIERKSDAKGASGFTMQRCGHLVVFKLAATGGYAYYTSYFFYKGRAIMIGGDTLQGRASGNWRARGYGESRKDVVMAETVYSYNWFFAHHFEGYTMPERDGQVDDVASAF